MSKSTAILPKSLLIFGICIPLALIVGYLLATPEDFMSFGAIGMLLLVLCIPLLLRWHYPLLIFCWNANMSVFFLPGQPSLWMLLAGASLFFTVMACVMDKEFRFQHVPSITWPLVFLTLVVLITAKMTGGIGLRSLGGGMYGGKKLVVILAAIIGYFAISSQRIPLDKAERYTGMFFLSGLTNAVSNLIYFAGPSLYFLYLFFTPENALSQALEDFASAAGATRFQRLPGVTAAAMVAFYFMLSRYGLRGVLDPSKPWRGLLLLICVGFSLLGGFRSALIIFGLILAFQFYFEGLFRTRLFLVLVLSIVLGGALLVPFVGKLPLSAQRSLSFLPLNIDAAAKADAQGSLDWRLEMWQVLLPEVREYFFLGKGYALNPTDMYLAEESMKRGLSKGFDAALVAGDYHSGPLSIMIPFGIFGLIGFIWLLLAGWRLLYRNYKFGDAALKKLNTFLLSYFTARALFYFAGFGAFNSDLFLFLGVLGLSVALNGGMRSPRSVPVVAAVEPETGPLKLKAQLG